MDPSTPERDLFFKIIAAVPALVSLCGIALGGWALAAGALGTFVAYNLPAPPTCMQITPPPTSTPRIRSFLPSPTVEIDAKSAKKTRAAQPGGSPPTRAPSDLGGELTTQTPTATSEEPPALGAPGMLTPTLFPSPTIGFTPTASPSVTIPNPAGVSRTPAAPTATRTPTRTLTQSSAATATTTASGPVFIDLVGTIVAVAPKQTAAVSVKTIPNAICEIIYLTPDGREPHPQELSPVNSGDDGICSWEWTIDAGTPPGTGMLYITVNDFTKYFNIVILGG